MSKISRCNSPLRRIFTLLGVALGLVAIVCLWQHNLQKAFSKFLTAIPEPEVCAICGKGGDPMWYHAPCLADLSTGQVVELTVYDPHLSLVGEIAEKQQTGTLCILQYGGLTALRDTCDHTCSVTLPKERAKINPTFFCQTCRGLLAGVAQKGYVLLDLHDLQNITVYPIEADTEHEIRDYTVSIQQSKDQKHLIVKVYGNLRF